MRKSSLSLLQRFPCPRNQKRTWDLYQRQILMGVKDVKIFLFFRHVPSDCGSSPEIQPKKTGASPQRLYPGEEIN